MKTSEIQAEREATLAYDILYLKRLRYLQSNIKTPEAVKM